VQCMLSYVVRVPDDWEEETVSRGLAIEAVGLEKSFGATLALAGLDLAMPTGTILGVLGPNGSGKTTAVRVLTTLLRADRGTARVAGYDVVTQATQVRRHIGLAGQSAALDEPLTGLDPRSRVVLWDIIRTLVADGTTVLLTTQYLEEADQLADRIDVID